MKQFNYTIKEKNGIHARPAGLLVREAQKYKSEIAITCCNKHADLKRMFDVMGIGVKKGEIVTVTLSGEDEEIAVQALEDFIKANF